MRINIDSIGDDLYNAYNEGFGDGMKEIIGMIEEFKKKKYLREHEYIMALRELELYILKNKPRRKE